MAFVVSIHTIHIPFTAHLAYLFISHTSYLYLLEPISQPAAESVWVTSLFIMNTTQTELRYGWTALILAILLVIVVILWLGARRDLRVVTESAGESVSYYGQQLVKECTLTPSTPSGKRLECADALAGLKETIKGYGSLILWEVSTTSGDVSTTSTTTGVPSGVPVY